MSANFNVWRGLGAGFIFRYYSGYPINETIGSDSVSFPGTNGDGDANDRPVKGLNDTTRPILSPVDSTGARSGTAFRARNRCCSTAASITSGEFSATRRGCSAKIYNLTDQVNYGNPTGNRNNSNYMVRTVAGDPRTVQLGVRLTF